MQSKALKHAQRTAKYEFSIGVRFTHWVRMISICVLIFTGLYLGYAFVSPGPNNGTPIYFLQAKFRAIHQIFGFILIGCVIFKSYLFIFDKKSKDERVGAYDVFKPHLWARQIAFYLFRGKHPHLKGVYNPLQFVSYIVFYILMLGIILTGLMLYMHNYHEGFGGFIAPILQPLEAALGGLAKVRIYHDIIMWMIIIFIPIHIYMAVFNTIKSKDGMMDAIFSGYKFDKK